MALEALTAVCPAETSTCEGEVFGDFEINELAMTVPCNISGDLSILVNEDKS